MRHILDNIKDLEKKKGIIERTGDETPSGDGLECPHCGAFEVYKNSKEPNNTSLWYFMIRAFRVDNSSECRNCGSWF